MLGEAVKGPGCMFGGGFWAIGIRGGCGLCWGGTLGSLSGAGGSF